MTKLTKAGVDLTDVSDQVNPYMMTEHKGEADFKQKVANHTWQWNGFSPVQDAEYRRNFYLGGHLNAAGYLLTSRMVAAYMDYIIRNHPEDFAQVGFIGGDVHYIGAKW